MSTTTTTQTTPTTINDVSISIPVGIAYRDLIRSDKNMRVLKSDNENDRALLASVRAKGIIQNLVVYHKNESYHVLAGGRRLAALDILFSEGVIDVGYIVPCLVRSEAEAKDLTIIENMQRQSPHAADVYTAFVSLLDDGQNTSDIARTHGITKLQVERYMRLGRVHKTLFNLFRKNKLTLAQMMAYGSTADTKLQLATFKAAGCECNLSVSTIKDQLSDSRRSEDSALVKFVTLSSYVDAGGQVESDLFENKSMVCDIRLLVGLAESKLEEEAEKLRAEGWKYVDIQIDTNSNFYHYNRLPSTNLEVPAALQFQMDDLDVKIRALNELLEDEYCEKTDYIYDELEALKEVLVEHVDDVTTIYADKDKQYAGCIVTVCAHSGDLVVHKGLLNDDDLKLFRQRDNDTEDTELPNGEQIPVEKAEISASLAHDLGRYRRSIMQAELASNPKLAVDLMHFQLCKSFLSNAMLYWEKDFDVNISKASSESSISDFDDTQAGHTLDTLYKDLDLGFLTPKTPVKQFQVYRELSAIKKNKLLAYCAGCSLTSGANASGKSTIAGLLCNELEIQFSDHWRPSKSNYFSRLTKGLLLPIGKKMLGAAWAKENANSSKKVVVEALDALFHGESESLTEKQLEFRASWMPKEIK